VRKEKKKCNNKRRRKEFKRRERSKTSVADLAIFYESGSKFPV
jgi:hypothetical protein